MLVTGTAHFRRSQDSRLRWSAKLAGRDLKGKELDTLYLVSLRGKLIGVVQTAPAVGFTFKQDTSHLFRLFEGDGRRWLDPVVINVWAKRSCSSRICSRALVPHPLRSSSRWARASLIECRPLSAAGLVPRSPGSMRKARVSFRRLAVAISRHTNRPNAIPRWVPTHPRGGLADHRLPPRPADACGNHFRFVGWQNESCMRWRVPQV